MGLNDRPGFSPRRCPLAPETQADGLGWYGVAPSVLGFAAIRTSAPQAGCGTLVQRSVTGTSRDVAHFANGRMNLRKNWISTAIPA